MPTKNTHPEVLFSLGQVVATPGALDLLDRAEVNAEVFLRRHLSGDWGAIPPEDALANEEALLLGLRVMSSYWVNERERLWIITEADRSATTLLLPDEY